ncbi:glutathione S-transferase family protein [Roseovarius sp. LXJ103]|uniref:glutathione S-transferase family protein n=1 Tax=Roseovarius carneus TaxID=2853164 RepID=UPI000D61E316|nr:glutathione S-transferase family protein [Roseovarius carneus]MBZ8117997.1 glutathione S-transferase family protein [Roseovarius carneus]PWE36254.1 glutathione S-transferase [Pelagicola sp. LXJ1103]
MKLYYMPGTVSMAVAIGLHEASVAFEPCLVNFKEGAQTKPAYHAINPKGRVPALDTGASVLTETGAILDYLAAIRPEAGLMPNAPEDAAHMRAVMYYLASTMHVNHAHGPRGIRWADAEASHADMRAKMPVNMTENAAYVEAHCLRGTYVLGDQISIADPYLFTVCSWLEADRVDVRAFPKILAFRAAMEARPSVKAVRAAGIMP